MSKHIVARFDNLTWDQASGDAAPHNTSVQRVSIQRRFEGELSGESSAELLMCMADDNNAGYVAVDSFSGSLGGRNGSFVFQHGGTIDNGDASSWGNVVPGSGTGELHGLRGQLRMEQAPDGAHMLTFDYELPSQR